MTESYYGDQITVQEPEKVSPKVLDFESLDMITNSDSANCPTKELGLAKIEDADKDTVREGLGSSLGVLLHSNTECAALAGLINLACHGDLPIGLTTLLLTKHYS